MVEPIVMDTAPLLGEMSILTQPVAVKHAAVEETEVILPVLV